MKKAMNDEKQTIVIFLGTIKFSNRVSHHEHPLKVKSYHIRIFLVVWFFFYLNSRVHIMNVDETPCKPCLIASGVILGSLLDSPPFIMYINNYHIIMQAVPFLFAEYIKIVYRFSARDIKTTLNNARCNPLSLDSWCRGWLTKFSAKWSTTIANKCHFPTWIIEINQEVIPSLQIPRYLGLHYFSKTYYGLLSVVCFNVQRSDRLQIDDVQQTFKRRLLGCSSSLNYVDR